MTTSMNEFVYRVYTTEDVKGALFQMAPSKAPGVDGFTAGFFSASLGVVAW